MQIKGHKSRFYRFISVVIIVALLVTILLPTNTVSASAAPILTKTSQNILIGNTYTIGVKNKISGASYAWKSSDKSIATVNKKGAITGIKKGVASITCTIKSLNETYTLKCTVSIRKPAGEIVISNKVDYLLVGQSYDLNRKLNPKSSNDITTWSSNNSSVIVPDKSGKFTAKKIGVATITATTLSKESDSATIYVVKEKSSIITKDDVVDGKVILEDKSLGDLTITKSVGNATIELDHVTIGGTLTMEDGAAYTVTTNESTINKVNVVESIEVSSLTTTGNHSEISSMAAGDLNPSLVAGKGSMIVTIDSECNISVSQSGGAIIQSFSVVTKQDGSIEISLEGFNGDLIIDSQSKSSINIVTTACEMSSATVKNASEGQKINLTDTNAGTDKASTIQTVNMDANAALTVNVKADEVKISKEVNQGNINIEQPVNKLTNEGSKTSLSINSQIGEVNSTGSESTVSLGNTARVQNLTVTGTGTNVELKKGAEVTTVTSSADNSTVSVSEGANIQRVITSGSNSTIEGSGKVESAVVTGNNSKVDTDGTSVEIAKGTTGVSVGGVEVETGEEAQVVTSQPTVTPTPPPINPGAPGNTGGTTTPPVPPVQGPTDAQKLIQYNSILTNLHVATTACVETSNVNNLAAVKTALNSLKELLKTYNEIDTNYATVVISDDYLYDYAEYIEFLIPNGSDFGLPIKSYYASKTAGEATKALAVSAANRILWLVYRVNTDTQFFSGDVNGVFQSVTGSPEEFYAAMNKLLLDEEEFTGFPPERAEYYQDYILQWILIDDYTRSCYESDTELTFLEAISCFLNISNYYGDELASVKYDQLLDNLIQSMPEITVVYTEPDENNVKHFDYIEYDLQEEDKAAVLAALEKMFDEVDLSKFFWEDMTDFTVPSVYLESLIHGVAIQANRAEPYPNGIYELLNYYLEHKGDISDTERVQAAYDATARVLWMVFNTQIWNDSLMNLHEATAACVADTNATNLGEVKTALNVMIQQLKTYEYLNPDFEGVELKDEYLFDYAQYFEFLVQQGADFGLPIMQFYESEALGEEYKDMAISAADRTVFLIDRVNKEKETQLLAGDVSGVFLSLTGTPDEFLTAMNKLLLDQGEFTGFTQDQAAYYQGRILQRIQADYDANNCYESDTELTFFEINSCFLNINRFYGEEQAAYSNSALYEELVDNVIAAMPEMTAFLWFDDETGISHFDHIEYDKEADNSEVITAIQAVFDSVTLKNYFGEEGITEYTINPLYVDSFIRELGRQIKTSETYADVSVNYLNYYVTNEAILENGEKNLTLYECIDDIIWTSYNCQQGNDWYIKEYKDFVDGIISAAEDDNAEGLYQALLTLYGKKLSDEGSAQEWSEYYSPSDENGATIDKEYCLQLIQAKMQAVSNSQLYYYIQSGTSPSADLLDFAIYELRDAVRDSNLNLLQKWQPIIADIDVVLEDTTSESNWTSAINALINFAKTDEVISSNFTADELNELALMTGNIGLFRQDIKVKKEDGTSQSDDPDNPWYYNLYLYDQNKEGIVASIGLLEGTCTELLWMVIDFNRDVKTFELGNELISALLAKDVSQTYDVLSSINDFRVVKDGYTDGTLQPKAEYAQIYFDILNRCMFNPEDTLSVYYDVYQSDPTHVYSKSILDSANKAIWGAHWWLTADAETEVQEEYNNYISWSPILDVIDAVMNVETVDADWDTAMTVLLNFEESEELLSKGLTTEDLAKLVVMAENRNLYRSDISARKADSSPHIDESSNTWYESYYLYDQNKLKGITDYYLIDRTYIDLLYSVLSYN